MITKSDIHALVALVNRWPQTDETRAWASRFVDDLAALLPPDENMPEKAAQNDFPAPEVGLPTDRSTKDKPPLRPPPLGGY